MSQAHVDRTQEVTSFAKDCVWTGATVDDRSKWLELRKTMLTASDIAAILGEDPHRSALDVYVDKLVTKVTDEVLTLDDPRFWGIVLEQPVLRAVAAYRGWGYRAGGALLRSRKHPILGATLDAEVDIGDGVWVDLEGKTSRIPKDWDEDTGNLPTRVLVQVQAQLLVTGAPMAIVFALLQGSRPVQIPIQPSREFHEIIVERAAEFMTLVRTMMPPEPNGSDADGRALARLYPRKDDGSVIALPAESVEWTDRIQRINALMARLDRRKKFYQQMLKSAMGDATFGVLPSTVGGKSCWRWASQERPAYEVEAGKTEVLLALKLPPAGAPPAKYLRAANDGLVHALEASTGEDTQPERIRFGSRKRSRR